MVNHFHLLIRISVRSVCYRNFDLLSNINEKAVEDGYVTLVVVFGFVRVKFEFFIIPYFALQGMCLDEHFSLFLTEVTCYMDLTKKIMNFQHLIVLPCG